MSTTPLDPNTLLFLSDDDSTTLPLGHGAVRAGRFDPPGDPPLRRPNMGASRRTSRCLSSARGRVPLPLVTTRPRLLPAAHRPRLVPPPLLRRLLPVVHSARLLFRLRPVPLPLPRRLLPAAPGAP
jgi:hypothetical protein